MLNVQNVSYYLANRNLLDEVSFQLPDGLKGGLVGRNGCGKSTLFKIILGQNEPDKGKIEVSRGLKIATVAQEVPSGESTPLEFLLKSDNERVKLFEALETITDANELGDIYDRLIQIDAYSAESRAAIILKGIGFSEEEQTRPLSSFSGGFRMRIALAAALFQSPDLLLLDEPTNHLDLETVLWLQDFLKTYPHSLLIISHDKNFLNEILDYVFHLQKGKIITYRGNYSIYEQKYKQQLASDASFNKKVEAQKQHMQKFVDRFRFKASKAKQAQSRIKAIEKLNSVELIVEDPTIRIEFPEPEQMPNPIISFDKLTLGYSEEAILKNISGVIANDDRIALLGANGNGKSTFAKFLARELKPIKGEINFWEKLRIGYFNQHQFERLDLEGTPFSHVKEILPNANQTEIRTHLGCFGFQQQRADQQVKLLSGGEKARLVFCLITTLKPHILILDEPTNHLDINMMESLIYAINSFEGAVILITHDFNLLSQTVDKLWLVANKTISNYNGTIEDYRAEILKTN